MNWKTTILLIVLVAVAAGGWVWFANYQLRTADPPSETVTFLNESLKPDQIARIEAQRGKTTLFTLERNGQEWSLPGTWPIRTQETDAYLKVLTSLHTRFAPMPISKDTDLAKLGLSDDSLVLKVTIGNTTHTLRFGEEAADVNRFTRATYVRLDDKPEVVRLGPGIVASLDRRAEHFLQRRLFPVERVAKEEDSSEKIEQVSATQIEVETPSDKFTLVKVDKDWVLKEAHHKTEKGWEKVASEDRVDPAKMKAILSGIPDLWAEKFIESKDKSAKELGLKEPEYTLTVTRPSGAKSKLLIGKVSDKKTKVVSKPPPPPQFGMPPKPPMPEIVTEEYRYAQLENSDRIFEVKSNKLTDIAAPLDVLRDPQLARFRTDDVKRIEMQVGDQQIMLAKVKEKEKDVEREKWRFEKPKAEEAETKPVEELLDKLSGLQARDKEVLDKADLKSVGLDKPAVTIKLTLEEGKDEKKKKTRQLAFQFGTKEKEKDKAYVRVDGWPRVNQVADDVLKLAQRPVLAYRQRRVLDLAASDVKRIEIQRTDEKFAFERKASEKEGDWKLTEPVAADVQASKVESLAGDLSKLEIAEFISEAPKQEDLDKTYGLAKPKLTVTFQAKDAKKTLAIGNQREGKSEYFARLDTGPVVAIKKDLRDELDRTSLSYRDLQLWQTTADAVTEIQVHKGSDAYRLKKEASGWRITEPIQAEAMPIEVEEMAEAVARLKAERIEAHQAKDLAKFGLDKPAIKIELTESGKKRTIEIGKTVEAGKDRYAKVSGSDAIVVLPEKAITPFDRGAFDLLDKTLLSVNTSKVERVRVKGESAFTLEPSGKDGWQVVDSPTPKFAAEEDAALGFLQRMSLLRAEKYVAYGSKTDWAQYGLDKPATTIELSLKSDDKKTMSHVIELGKTTEKGERYARLDKKEAVVLLNPTVADALSATHLDFLDRRVLKFDTDALTSIKRAMKDADVELTRQDDQWRIIKPSPARDADNLTLSDLIDKTFRLRAKRIYASPGKDLKSLGLDPPVATVTLELDSAKHVIKVGNLAKNAVKKDTDERFAIIDSNPAVVVLSAELSRHLTGSVLYYADRNLASLSGIDTVQVQRGQRKTEFKKPDNKWQMVAPVKADAEDAALEDLVRGVQRLRADEIIAEKDVDAKKYGLDQPAMQFNFKSGDTSKLHLVIGAEENGKRYARVGEKGPVFLLSAKLTAKIGDEFRGRKPWASFDAAQVERLTIASPDKTFTLQKREGGWSVADEDDKVDAAKVSDTLDALASLKVLRYLADAKGDLALYGLAKPAWRIEVSTPSGKRELLLGRTEGTSTRFYATVAGSDAVFLIDEADAARIARPFTTFVIAEKKK